MPVAKASLGSDVSQPHPPSGCCFSIRAVQRASGFISRRFSASSKCTAHHSVETGLVFCSDARACCSRSAVAWWLLRASRVQAVVTCVVSSTGRFWAGNCPHGVHHTQNVSIAFLCHRCPVQTAQSEKKEVQRGESGMLGQSGSLPSTPLDGESRGREPPPAFGF